MPVYRHNKRNKLKEVNKVKLAKHTRAGTMTAAFSGPIDSIPRSHALIGLFPVDITNAPLHNAFLGEHTYVRME